MEVGGAITAPHDGHHVRGQYPGKASTVDYVRTHLVTRDGADCTKAIDTTVDSVVTGAVDYHRPPPPPLSGACRVSRVALEVPQQHTPPTDLVLQPSDPLTGRPSSHDPDPACRTPGTLGPNTGPRIDVDGDDHRPGKLPERILPGNTSDDMEPCMDSSEWGDRPLATSTPYTGASPTQRSIDPRTSRWCPIDRAGDWPRPGIITTAYPKLARIYTLVRQEGIPNALAYPSPPN